MHELSIVMSIVDLAEEQVKKHRARGVDRIELDIGALAGVEFDALDFAWNAGVKNSVLATAQRQVNRIEGKMRCMKCGKEFTVTEPFQPCPDCQDYLNEFLQGKELRVKSLTMKF
ncbi:MAG: hydrogenase maturation nickel metallochaperone HypA [Cyclobacteriaceae bacterium]|nr:hydrogenase maturation nickel metallochaperone HypA [Cyclobacteriaceae bacterium]